MRTLPTGMQAHLDSGTTTLCYCWRVTRHDAVVMGFTDHDNNLTFLGTTFTASTGFDASMAQQALGLAVDNMELVGALDSAAIKEEDIAAGRYDDAFIEIFQVNWADVTQRVIVMTGYLGELTQTGQSFTAEMRGLTSRLGQALGRVYQRTCDAVFGDSRCKFNKASVTYTATVATVTSPRGFTISGVSALANNWLSRGTVTWTSGLNSGSVHDIKVHTNLPSPTHTIELWAPCAYTPQVGDTLTVSAGCLQTPDVCKTKFNNLVNFQGFPHMPGNDSITAYPKKGGSNQDGGSRV